MNACSDSDKVLTGHDGLEDVGWMTVDGPKKGPMDEAVKRGIVQRFRIKSTW